MVRPASRIHCFIRPLNRFYSTRNPSIPPTPTNRSSIVSKWECMENLDGSISIHNCGTGKVVRISHECIEHGCSSPSKIFFV